MQSDDAVDFLIRRLNADLGELAPAEKEARLRAWNVLASKAREKEIYRLVVTITFSLTVGALGGISLAAGRLVPAICTAIGIIGLYTHAYLLRK